MSSIIKAVITGSLTPQKHVSGSLTGTLNTIGTFNFSTEISGEITVPQDISMKYGFYKGQTQVKPTFEDQMLLTEGKIVENNITVFKIQTYQTSNEFGTTFII